jgi:GTP-binding protein
MDTAGVDGDRLLHVLQQQQQNSRPTTTTNTKNQMTLSFQGRQDQDDHLVQRQMMLQTLQAAIQSDLIFLMFDARIGVTQDLAETARWLRKHFVPLQRKQQLQEQEQIIYHSSNKGDDEKNHHEWNVDPKGKDMHVDDDDRYFKTPSKVQQRVVLLANKLEGDRWLHDDQSPVMDNLDEAARIGFGEAIPISAEHGEGMADICQVIEELTQIKRGITGATIEGDDATFTPEELEKPLQLAILGRQNVGKSTLVNRLLNEERVIAGETPGLTRDSIAIEWEWNGRPVQLVDTAGIRKLSQRDHSNAIENMAVMDAMRAMKVADVAVLVLDAESRMLQRQELAIADAVAKEGRALVVAANKMDLIVERDYTQEDYAQAVRDQIEARLPILRKTPVVAMSSLTGKGVQDLMPVVFQARTRWAQTVATGLLNRWLADVMVTNPPPPTSGKPTKIKYIIQTKGRPPTFLLFCNVDHLPDSYVRFLMRNFQDSFEMFGMEVRMSVKKSSSNNPYHDKTKRSGLGLGGRERQSRRRILERRATAERLLRRKRAS